MNILKIASVFVCLLVLSACQTTTYKPITKYVRLATTYEDDKKTTVIGERIEMEDPFLGWFEAKKTADGTYKFTVKGLWDKQAAENADRGGDDDGGGC